jgi:phosphoribosyl 1,2-cyclic phosphate phosphodiesterase
MSMLEAVILGCGSSMGVPRVDGQWGACDPAEPKNRRTRCSLLVRRRDPAGGAETTVLVDTSPDLRTQVIAAKVNRIDAVLYTHDHADQTHGIDDLRGFTIATQRRVPCFMEAWTRRTLTGRFRYVFEGESGYPPICEAHDLPPLGEPWSVDGPSGPIPVVGFDQDHGPVRSVGFRFGGLAYSSDVRDLPESAFETLAGVDTWIVDALRWTPHPTHAHVDKALDWIARVRPRRAVLTNLHIDLDYAELQQRLPGGVEPAYDGMTITMEAA